MRTPAAPFPPHALQHPLLNAGRQAVVATDLEDKIIYWNRDAEALYGWGADEVLGRRMVDITGSETSREQVEEIRACLLEGRNWTVEVEMRRCDGTVFPARVTKTPLCDENGDWAGIISVSCDGSTEKVAPRELVYERASLQAIFDHAPAMMCVLRGPNHVVERANSVCSRYLGYRDVIGKPVAEVFPEFSEQVVEGLDDIYSTGQPFVVKEMPIRRLRTPEGAVDYFNFVYQPLKQPDGSVSGILVHGIEVTEQVVAQELVRKTARANAAIMNRSLDVICTIDREGRFIQVSAASEKVWGYAPSEMLGREYRAFIYAGDAERTLKAQQDVLEGLDLAHFENRYVRKDGVIVDMMWTSFWSEEDQRFFAVARDVTEMKARERSLAVTNAALKKSEQRLRTLVNAMAQVVWTADEQGSVIELSDAWTELTGQTEEELKGWGWTGVLHPEDRDRVIDAWRKNLERKAAYEDEFRVRCANGSYRWVSARKIPLFDPNGAFVEWVGTCTDIDARKKTEAALRRSEARYRTIIDTAHEGVWLIDAEARTRFVNARISEILGYTIKELQGQAFFDFVMEEDKPLALAKFDRRRQGMRETYDLRFRCRDGSVRWMLISGCPFYDEAGRFAGSLGMMTDITERKRYEQGLIEAKEKAEEMNRLKTSFLANMSHELRTPLTAILSLSEILAEEVTGEHQELAEMIGESGERLLETLISVLDLAQLESGTHTIKPGPVDVIPHLRSIVNMLRHRAAKKNIELKMEAPEEPVTATLDVGALDRILTNLVANAIKFTEAGSVTVSLEAARSELVLTVADTGIGISPEFLPHIFDEFKQESMGVSRDYEGSGLGLTLTRRLIELMGGTISVESTKHVGSVFRLRLPRDPSTALRRHEPGVPAATTGRLHGLILEHTPSKSPPPRLRMLVVEDNPHTRHVYRHLLAPAYDVAFATKGEEALEHARHGHFDVILLDIRLGNGLKGDDILRELRAREAHRKTPIIAVTAQALPGDAERLLEMGFTGYLSKPFKRSDLERALRVALSIHTLQMGGAASEGTQLEELYLEELLELAQQRKLVDGYEKHRGEVVLAKGFARFRLSRIQAWNHLIGLLRDDPGN